MENMPFIEIPLRGVHGQGKVTLVDADYDGEYFSLFKWTVLPNGYVAAYGNYICEYDERGLLTERTQPFIYLHRLVGAPPKGMWATHKDGNKLNNRSCNIVWITPKQSALNRELTKTRQ